ncbi:MAG: hypothetical protein NC300_11400 [Bacteroidales bacterium]|nr:hypothetical protein [Clostridium sp.]MCM1204737.1 hypothetical protein [Bacteroidales bacterium]
MNIAGMMKKLQRAILETGLVVNINRTQFYSADQKRFIPVISLTTKVFHYYESTKEWKEQTFEIIRTSSQIDVLTCLVDIYKAVSG